LQRKRQQNKPAISMHAAWQTRRLWPLLPVSGLYAALLLMRRWYYRCRGTARSQRLPVPVVVVGNVIAGGAGKTPVTLAVVQHLRASGWQPGIISRGYGRATRDCRQAHAVSAAREVGDEPVLLAAASGVPVFVARQRAEAGRALLAAYPATDILVCDDGLQHLALARDVEICVFNEEGIGNGWLLPAGPLRELWPRAVDFVLAPPVCNLSGGGRQFPLIRRLTADAVDAHGQRVPLAALRQQPLHAVAAIARPQAFFAMLRAQGLMLEREEALPDHYDFVGWKRASPSGLRLVCTEKDAVKLWPMHPDALAVPLHVQLDAGFFPALDAILAARMNQRLPKALPRAAPGRYPISGS